MRKFLVTAMLVGTMGSLPMMMGCDRTLHEEKKVTTGSNGEQTKTETKTVQHPDGTVTTEKEAKHVNPNAVP
jgi:hypothetical protein